VDAPATLRGGMPQQAARRRRASCLAMPHERTIVPAVTVAAWARACAVPFDQVALYRRRQRQTLAAREGVRRSPSPAQWSSTAALGEPAVQPTARCRPPRSRTTLAGGESRRPSRHLHHWGRLSARLPPSALLRRRRCTPASPPIDPPLTRRHIRHTRPLRQLRRQLRPRPRQRRRRRSASSPQRQFSPPRPWCCRRPDRGCCAGSVSVRWTLIAWRSTRAAA